MGVFSGIKSLFSIIKDINLQTLVNSLLIPNLLQYLSINDDGVVLLNDVLSLLDKLCSNSLIIDVAFLHPLVALV